MSEIGWHVQGEPVAIYLDRLRSHELATAYVDTNLAETVAAVKHHLQETPDIAGVRVARRIVGYLSAHPLLDDEQKLLLAGSYNQLVDHYHVNPGQSRKHSIEPVMADITLHQSVDDFAEVGYNST